MYGGEEIPKAARFYELDIEAGARLSMSYTYSASQVACSLAWAGVHFTTVKPELTEENYRQWYSKWKKMGHDLLRVTNYRPVTVKFAQLITPCCCL